MRAAPSSGCPDIYKNILSLTGTSLRDHVPALHRWPIAQTQIINSQVSAVLDSGPILEMIPNEKALAHAMEALGVAFSFPIAMSQNIKSTLKWFFEFLFLPLEQSPLSRVSDETEREETVIGMFSHLSLIFQLREDSMSNINAHAGLCKDAILFFVKYFEQRRATGRRNLSTEKTIIHIMLGITDYLLSHYTSLTEMVIPSTLHAFFSAWLQTGLLRSDEMWALVGDVFHKWSFTKEPVYQWASLIEGITNKILNILYGPNEGSGVLHLLSGSSANVVDAIIDLGDDVDYFDLWRRTMALIRQPKDIEDGETFFLKVKPVCYIALLFSGVGNKIRADTKDGTGLLPPPPTIRSLLDLFGGWIFDTVIENRAGFEEGTKIALATLCKIMVNSDYNPSDLPAVSGYYTLVKRVMEREDTQYLVPTLLFHSSRIFMSNLPQSQILIPHYLRVACGVLENFSDTKSVGPALEIISSIAPYGYLYPEIVLPDGFEFRVISDEIFSVLSKYLEVETGSEERSRVMEILYHMQCYSPSPEIYQTLADALSEMLRDTEDCFSKWVAFRFVRQLAFFAPTIVKENGSVLPTLTESLLHILRQVVDGTSLSCDIVCESMSLIELLLLSESTWFNDHKSLLRELEKLRLVLESTRAPKKAAEDVRNNWEKVANTARLMYERIAKLIGCSEYERRTPLNERDLRERVKDFVYLSVGDETILSIAEVRGESGKLSNVVVVSRDGVGKSVWEFEFLPESAKVARQRKAVDVPPYSIGESSQTPIYRELPGFPEHVQEDIGYTYGASNLSKPLYSSEMEFRYSFLSVMSNYEFLLEETYRFFQDRISNHLGNRWMDPGPRVARLHADQYVHRGSITVFLESIGYFGYSQSMSKGDRQVSILVGDDIEEGLISEVDSLESRTATGVGVVFLSEGQNRLLTSDKIRENREGSADFEAFVSGLGEPVSADPGVVAFGTVDWVKRFVIATRSSDGFDRATSRSVVIVWVDGKGRFDPKLILNDKIAVLVKISPYASAKSLRKVEIFKNQVTPKYMSFYSLKNFVVSSKKLPHVLREMTSTMDYLMQVSRNKWEVGSTNLEARKDKIQSIISSRGKKLSFYESLKYMFTPRDRMSTEQV